MPKLESEKSKGRFIACWMIWGRDRYMNIPYISILLGK
jgi:hypothetical protein